MKCDEVIAYTQAKPEDGGRCGDCVAEGLTRYSLNIHEY